MAPHKRTEQTARAGAGGGTANRAEKRVLLVGSVGLALLVGMVVGLVAGRGGPAAPVSERTASAALAGAATSGPYLLSPPNEHDPDGDAGDVPALRSLVGPASAGPYLLSPPNERDPGELGHAADRPTYRLSPPNETDPGP
jgi:hypothetical protein